MNCKQPSPRNHDHGGGPCLGVHGAGALTRHGHNHNGLVSIIPRWPISLVIHLLTQPYLIQIMESFPADIMFNNGSCLSIHWTDLDLEEALPHLRS